MKRYAGWPCSVLDVDVDADVDVEVEVEERRMEWKRHWWMGRR